MNRLRLSACTLLVALLLGLSGISVLAQPSDSLLALARTLRPDPKQPVGPNLTAPLGWQVRLDRAVPNVVWSDDADHADIWFVSMTPGWHVTTRPAGIFWHPASTAEGRYRAEAGIYLFGSGEHPEGFGLFVGGKDLLQDGQVYLYFLLRGDGQFLIKRRAGSQTHVVQDWTAHAAIQPFMPGSGDQPFNRLAVAVDEAEVVFLVNGTEVARHPKAGLPTDGIVGLRLNHHVNVHVSEFGVATR